MQSKVSIRGQTVIPREIRKALGITTQTVLRWELKDGVILVYPLPPDPVRASLGILKGKGTFQEFLEERALDRASEPGPEG